MISSTVSNNEPRARGANIADIRRIGGSELTALLAEQVADWDRTLDWDFSGLAELVRGLADSRRLDGATLLDQGQVAGCGYAALERRKGVIVDIYVRPAWRNASTETALFDSLFEALTGVGVRRVESQLMLVDDASSSALRRKPGFKCYERLLMKRDAAAKLPPAPGRVEDRCQFEPWRNDLHEPAAAVLAKGHAGHIDAAINDQYASVEGAWKLVRNIVHFNRCDAFHAPASFVAFEKGSGSPVGVVLASFIGADVAHITELCVTPEARGAGLGYELLRRSASALGDAGAKRISVIVTAANEGAVRLYERCGFRTAHQFCAYVWEK
jgi:ribosomal protein S18 acetylase RimI-like enzyme